jgi:hypothetical protein
MAGSFRDAHGRPGKSAGLEVDRGEQVPREIGRVVQLGGVGFVQARQLREPVIDQAKELIETVQPLQPVGGQVADFAGRQDGEGVVDDAPAGDLDDAQGRGTARGGGGGTRPGVQPGHGRHRGGGGVGGGPTPPPGPAGRSTCRPGSWGLSPAISMPPESCWTW